MALKNIKWPNSSRKKESKHSDSAAINLRDNQPKWRTIIGLIVMYTAVTLNWQWLWGVLSLYWVLPSLFTGITYFIEPIKRKDNPILFWIISITWIVFSVVMFFPSSFNPS